MRVSRTSITVLGTVVLGVALLAQAPGGGAPPAAGPAVAPDAPGGRQGQGGRAGRGGRGGRGGGVQIQPGEECPPGMTEWRVNSCRAPEFPAPSILDYRPRSTLVAAEHVVPRAKFGAVDYHAHVAGMLTSQETLAAFMKQLDGIGVQLAVSADSMSGERLQRAIEVVRTSPYKDRVRILTGISFQGVGPGWAERAVAQLEADVKAGAVGVGEIGKGLGLSTRKADGTRLKIDDPDLDPVWAACARLNIPVFIHTADPPEFFQPLDYHNERWLELALFPDRRWMTDEYPKIEELFAERDRLFRKHPKTRFVAAHLGWHGSDLARLGKLFDEMPNVTAELGAVLYELGRQPRAAREFFIKYQDRLLFGKDTFAPSEFPYYWRVFETADEYFDYYRNYHAFWKLYGLDLPDAVLKKVYYQNAVRITPGLPQTGWPK
jgi:predicted TIM-barrel fold metal-dependent hydrolase